MPRRPTTATRVRRIVADLTDSAGSRPDVEGLALIAERLADLVDSTREDPGRQLTALRELRTTLDALTRATTGAGRDVDRGRGAPAGDVGGDSVGDVDRELAELMGAGPTRGDSADS